MLSIVLNLTNKHAQLMYSNNAQYHSNSTQNSRRFYSTQYSLYSTIILKYVLTFLVICAAIQFFNMDAFSSAAIQNFSVWMPSAAEHACLQVSSTAWSAVHSMLQGVLQYTPCCNASLLQGLLVCCH